MKNKGFLVIIAVILAIAGLLYWKTKSGTGSSSSAHFEVGDYIQKIKETASAVWVITKVDPDLKTVSGATSYTGAYYGRLVKTDAEYPNLYTTFLWNMESVERRYNKIDYTA